MTKMKKPKQNVGFNETVQLITVDKNRVVKMVCDYSQKPKKSAYCPIRLKWKSLMKRMKKFEL